MNNLDKKDYKLLEILCENARISHNRIAKQVGLSKNAVTYRINRLKKINVIKGFFSILNSNALGVKFFEVLIKVKNEEEKLLEYIKNNDNVLVFDRISGEWSYICEIGSLSIATVYDFIREIEKFSSLISYEIHPIIEAYKVEQLPIKKIQKRAPAIFNNSKQECDNEDIKILYELDKDCTISLIDLAPKINLTAETVAKRLKMLVKNGIIIRFSAKINLAALGYEIYIVMIEYKENLEGIKQFILSEDNIRYSFKSASKPIVFAYYAAETSQDLDNFIMKIQSKFPNILNIKYNFSREQYKYQLFPKGLMKELINV